MVCRARCGDNNDVGGYFTFLVSPLPASWNERMGVGDNSGRESDGALWERTGSGTVRFCGRFVDWARAPAGRCLTRPITARVGEKKNKVYKTKIYAHEARS